MHQVKKIVWILHMVLINFLNHLFSVPWWKLQKKISSKRTDIFRNSKLHDPHPLVSWQKNAYKLLPRRVQQPVLTWKKSRKKTSSNCLCAALWCAQRNSLSCTLMRFDKIFVWYDICWHNYLRFTHFIKWIWQLKITQSV